MKILLLQLCAHITHKLSSKTIFLVQLLLPGGVWALEVMGVKLGLLVPFFGCSNRRGRSVVARVVLV